MNVLKMVRKAESIVRRDYPELSGVDFDQAIEDLISEWEYEQDEPEDTYCLESGRDNCDDWGTGEGQFHGRF